jgi:hypothetical protein
MAEISVYNNKIIDNIEPFNDVWYKYCFYSALFPIINCFCGTIIPFILNDIYFYDYQVESGTPLMSLKSNSIKTDMQLLNEFGISTLVKVKCENIVHDLLHSISNGSPVIISIDCFYESIRTDAYQKRHFDHLLLLYGYDTKYQYFNILESNYLDSIIYEKKQMSFSDVESCYNGFLNNIHNGKDASYYEYSGMKNYSQIDNKYYINDFKLRMFENSNFIIESLNTIDKFSEHINNLYAANSLDMINIDSLLNLFNDLINNKNCEKYRLIKVFGSLIELLDLLELIISSWNTIRGIIVKYQFTNTLRTKSLEVLTRKLSDIKQFESNYYNIFFKYLRTGGE